MNSGHASWRGNIKARSEELDSFLSRHTTCGGNECPPFFQQLFLTSPNSGPKRTNTERQTGQVQYVSCHDHIFHTVILTKREKTERKHSRWNCGPRYNWTRKTKRVSLHDKQSKLLPKIGTGKWKSSFNLYAYGFPFADSLFPLPALSFKLGIRGYSSAEFLVSEISWGLSNEEGVQIYKKGRHCRSEGVKERFVAQAFTF